MKRIIPLFLSLCFIFSVSCFAGAAHATDVVDFAKQYIGTPYSWGGEDPESGFDCSGFVYYVLSSCGHTVSRTANGQNADGMDVGLSLIQPGDIVVFGSGSSATHTAIYAGEGTIVHALNEASGVVCSSLSDYSDPVISVRRIQ